MPISTSAQDALRLLVLTIVHDPEDARIRHRQLQALLSHGVQVTYAAPFSAYGRTPPPGVRGLDVPRAVGMRRAKAIFAAWRLLRREVRNHDLVILHDPDLLLAAAAPLPADRRSMVWDVHEDTAAAVQMRPWIPIFLRRVAVAGIRWCERWAEGHLRLTLAEEAYQERFRAPHPVVPNSVFVPEEEPAPPGDDRVLYIGRLTWARGARELIELGGRLRGEVTVELIGPADADVAGALEAAQNRGDVLWRGFVPNSEALQRLSGAMAGLSLLHDEPNYNHSRPTKILEYMARGVVPVSTPNQASVDLIESASAGIVVPFGDVDAAERAVRRLRDDREFRESQARNGRVAAGQDHNWLVDGAHFVSVLHQWAQHRQLQN